MINKRRKRIIQNFFCILLFLICGVVIFINHEVLYQNPFCFNYKPSGPSYLKVDNKNQLYFIDSSKKSITIVEANGNIKCRLTPKFDGMFQIEEVCPAKDGFYFKVAFIKLGTLIERETICYYSKNEITEVYSINYDYTKNENPWQYGFIKSLGVFDDQLYFIKQNIHSIEVLKLEDTGDATVVEQYKTEEDNYISDCILISKEGKIVFDVRQGKVFLGSFGTYYTIYDSKNYKTQNFISIPWKLAVDDIGRIYVTDIGCRSIRNLSDGEILNNKGSSIMYGCSIQNGKLYATDYNSIYVSNYNGLVKDTRNYTYNNGFIFLRFLTWLCAIAFFILLIHYGFLTFKIFAKAIKNTNSKFSAAIIVAILTAVVTVSLKSCETLKSREQMWISLTLDRYAYMMQDFIDNNIECFDEIDELSDYKSEKYQKLQRNLNEVIYSSYFGNSDTDKIKNPMYYILYKNIDGTICSVMDFEDTMCAIHPMAEYEGSEYETVIKFGEKAEYKNSSAYGNWQYILYPIYDKCTMKIEGVLELGINSEEFDSVLKETVIDIGVQIAFVTILIIMLFMEGNILINSLKEYKALKSAEEMLQFVGYIRYITFFMYFCSSLQESFIAVAADKLYTPVLGISNEMASAFPISIQMFFCALFSVFSGKGIKRLSLKKLLIIGFTIDLVGFLICSYGIKFSYSSLLIGKAFIGIGMGICIAMTNIRASSIEADDKRNSTFSILNAGILAGATLGFSIGSSVATTFGYSKVFLLGAIILIAGIIISKKYVPSVDVSVSNNKIRNLSFVLNIKVLGFLFCTLLPFLIVINFREYFFTLYANENGYSESYVGRFFLICGFMIIYLGPIISNKLTKILGEKMMVILANSIFCAALGIFSVFPSMMSAMASVFLISIGISFGYTAQSGYYNELKIIRKTDEASAMGIYMLFDNIGQTVGPVIFGLAVSFGNRKGIFIIFLGFVVLSILFVVSSMGRKAHITKGR